MLSIEATRKRLRKVAERRYGISLVYGVPISETLLQVIGQKIKDIETKYPEIFHWYIPKNLHATILRCRSLDKPLGFPPREVHVLRAAVTALAAFRLMFQKAEVGHDGVLRFLFKEVSELAKLNLALIGQFAASNNVTLTPIMAPWIAFGDARNTPGAIERLESQIKVINKDLAQDNCHIESEVAALKLVYYEDVKFFAHTIVDNFGVTT